MKKNIFWGMFIIMGALLAGCTEGGGSSDSNQAYANEDEDEAVNTIQVGGKYRVTGPMDELKDAVAGLLGENYWPDTLLSAEELAERTGISENMYDDFLAEYQHTEAGIDMMILIKAREDNVELVENYLNDYRDTLLKIYEQQPQNSSKVFASRIETIDDYVCYIQLGANISNLKDRGSDEMIAYCLQENERALDILEKRILSE
ncbi:MAG: DUF4358 domain-containing protein [Clostridium sp.]|nr:DUF4358 domain-containing protein [Clostridium sp.]